MGGLGLIVTVGLSYLDFYGKYCLENREANGTTLDVTAQLSHLCAGADLLDTAIESFLKHLKCGGSRTSSALKYPSAELQTLALLLEQYPEYRTKPIKIILFYFDPIESKACAKALSRNLCHREFARLVLGLEPDEAGRAGLSVEEPLLVHMDMTDEARFGEHVLSFLTKVKEKAACLRKDQGCDSVIICATGGYKALTPFVSLLGFLEDEDVVYGYESSRSVLRLPGLPLTWDTRFLDEYRSLLKADGVSRDYYEKLPRRVQHFFLPVPSSDATTRSGSGANPEKYRRSAFGTMIAESYDTDRHLRYGYGEPLLERFQNANLNFRGKLDEILRTRWNYLWLGDQIPETVEHSRGHSARLMELARDLLDLTNIRLSDHELLALVVAIWLHDIGHVALASKELGVKETATEGDRPFPVTLFPSVVRECHHVLGYERIGLMAEEVEGAKKTKEAPKVEKAKEARDFPAADTLKTVAVMTLYHRGKMPLVSGQKPWKLCGLAARSTDPPLEERDSPFSIQGEPVDKPDGKDRLLLLTSLLRFLDACDVQADRVVDDYYAEDRRRRNDDERKDLQERLCAMLQGIAGRDPKVEAHGQVAAAQDRVGAHSPDGVAIQNVVFGLGCAVLGSVDALSQTGDSGRPPKEQEEPEKRKQLRGCLGPRVVDAAAALHYANADPAYLVALGLADSILFKHDQYEHYDKHRSVACVHLERLEALPEEMGAHLEEPATAHRERPRTRIEVCLIRPAEPATADEDTRHHLLKIRKAIEDEYEAVRQILSPYFELAAVTFQPPLEDEPLADKTPQFGPAKPGQGG